ncbi:hypothetical protein PL222_14420 [Salmonella enterica]|uniref:hypothetical protein n=1 Tax=Salmonella enterica TaxID=28901 RepID=UPI001DBA978E|nr:hypothetical protein [Salmonella enterica]EGY1700878.1 hypothetical protein [Salmonella enterica]MDO3816841.1 hypothetical protein [Salmonella enterica]MDO3824484.1 hypothetical protein [Salmonella enterica]
MTKNVSDEMCACFKSIVKRHAATIPDSQYAEYLAQSENNDSVYPNCNVYQGYGSRVSRDELVDKAFSVSGIRPTKYFSVTLAHSHEVIEYVRLSRGNSESATPVYFFSKMGMYAAALTERCQVVEVWLSWPAYPRGW